ncbi:DUF4382 domain-containing protein [Cyclobacterium sp.]|uniref:DUF4382 domain-containing protein n=1 Tax=Cyclobacterium sp. TaxID=1966343 RepID=UPI00198C665B|nr:DUF4382 domain-containing protein [Cyclobacterium sp.]MBD3630666.1 DUF4382 domain-containing protein [Cyclobacterium sp.]
MKRLNIKLQVAAILSFFILVGCNEQDGMMDGNARLSVSLIDAPADYDEVWVEVLALEVQPQGSDEDDASAWISIENESVEKKIDLLTLTGGNALNLGTEEIPAGYISQIRLILGNDNYIMQDGDRIDLSTPSAQQSGLKLQLNQELLAGIQYDLVLDFDAAQSIVKAGNSGQYILKPVLRVVAEGTASIKGKVSPLAASSTVFGIQNGDTLATFTDDQGDFILKGLNQGEYRVEIHPIEPYLGDTLFNVSTQLGEVTQLEPIDLMEEE